MASTASGARGLSKWRAIFCCSSLTRAKSRVSRITCPKSREEEAAPDAFPKPQNPLHDRFQLIELLFDNFHIPISLISAIKLQFEGLEEQLHNSEGISDLMGDFGREMTQRR